jgi:cell division protein FtsZ
METILEGALKYASTKPTPEQASKSLEIDPSEVRITVIGCGGAGTNTVTRLHDMGIRSAKTISINTDAKHLSICKADRKLLIGAQLTHGLGAGGYPEVGMKAAEASKDKIIESLDGSEIVFVTAGMGGGTGTGSAPVVAQEAKKQGALVVAMVSFPFALERARLAKADWGLQELSKHCDSVIVIDNNRLAKCVPNLPINQAFAFADEIMAKAVKGISDTVTLPSLVNIDFADIRAVLGGAGTGVIALGEGKGNNRVNDVIQSTLSHPLLEVDFAGSKGAILHIAGSPEMTLGEVNAIGEGITEQFDKNANVIWGARVDPALGDRITVTAIITGVTSPQVIGKTGLGKEIPSKQPVAMEAIETLGF